MQAFSRAKWPIVVTVAIVAIAAILIQQNRISRSTADALLSRADKLSWDNQWLEANPLYARAEIEFLHQGQPSKALYAHVSQFIVRAESDPIPSLLIELQKDLSLPQAREPETHLRILVIQGMIESNYDAGLARNTWQEVEGIAESRGHYLLMARAIGEQGLAAFLLGDFSTAKKLVTRAWLAAKYLHDDAAHVRYASMYGAGLVELQKYDEAIHVLDEAIDTSARSKTVAYPSIAINFKIDALRGLGRYSEALQLADQAIQRLPSARLDAHLYQIMTSKGEVYGNAGKWNEAIVQYTIALEYARRLKYWRGIVQTGGLLALAYEKQNRIQDALVTIDEAIQANKMIPAELYFSPRNMAIKAELLDKLGKQRESYLLHEKSLGLFDSLLATAPTRNVERELLNQMRDVYSRYFESLCREGNLNEAFTTIERARGRIQAQSISERPSPLPHDPTDDERKVAQMNLSLIENNDPGVAVKLDRALVESNLLAADTTLSGQTFRRPLELSQVQAHLGPKELVLEYVLDDPASSVLVITASGVKKYDLPSGDEIEHLASRYRREIHDRKTDTELARKLFSELIGPIAEYHDKQEIIIVPDGQLHLLPFGSLMENNEYAIQTHSFSVSPSASVLALLRDREEQNQVGSLGYIGVAASSEPQARSSWITRWASFGRSGSLDPLPQSKREVQTIAGYFPGAATVLLGHEATKANFTARPLDQYRVVHLALHGYADIEHPERSALVFAPDAARKSDGIMDLQAIQRLRFRASLVTLSACDTGVGPISEADVDNLANAFIEAGAESVVAALWDLEDQTTALLMTNFYKNLSMHERKGEALRNAQLDILAAGLPPYYWASVEVLGDASESV
ncbi:CHAT domain-containing protein [Acidicapsa ligni]|uniref:CHAT domain-containing protein n=1 Tax=Acidicapsa ligni TaxID=542300 RepID=UPI0021DF51AA|nr:CHAT domain-containing protein [Acidicapsa ligni]